MTASSQNHTLKGFALVPLLTPESLTADLGEMTRLMAQGELKVDIGGRYPLAKAAQAHRDLTNRHNMGKLVLIP